jgi:asparagine N-glycosylation enzyme membrane subunit Stt3
MLSGADYDEDPRLTLAVILPGVIVLLSAVAHLRSTNKIQRILSLLLGLLVAVAVSIWRHWYYILYGVFLAAIVFLPSLLESLRPQSKTMQAE